MPRTADEIRTQLSDLSTPRDVPGNDERLARALQIEATLLLVEAVEQLNESAKLTARCLDYLTDHLHEIGKPA